MFPMARVLVSRGPLGSVRFSRVLWRAGVVGLTFALVRVDLCPCRSYMVTARISVLSVYIFIAVFVIIIINVEREG